MHGVPPDLPVQKYVGDYLGLVGVDVGGIYLHFGKAGPIHVEGHWELRDAAGNLIDVAQEHENRDAYRIHVLLNHDVTSASVDPPRSFSMDFSNGYRLTVYDDSPQFESFSMDGHFV
jgi:hypothetical protein